MQIIHIIESGDAKKGGVAYASVRLALEQAKLGIDVGILEVTAVGEFLLEMNNSKVKHLNFFHRKYISQILFIWSSCKSKSIIFHFHGIWSLKYIPFFLAILIRKSKFIISPHGNLEPGALRQKKLKKFLARKLYIDYFLSRASVFWACSKKELYSIKNLFFDANVVVVPIGVDDSIPIKSCLPESWGLADKKIILCISRLSPEKGIINLVKAWSCVRSSAWHILIAGPDQGGYKKIIEKHINELDLKTYFTFLGYVDDDQKRLLYSNADFFVLPSLSENFGIVVIEAMSYGVPVLTTNETPWEYIGMERGCLCVGSSPEELFVGLMTMMNLDRGEREEISKRARTFVDTNFKWPKVVNIAQEKIKHLC